jgi:hypothetical protein
MGSVSFLSIEVEGVDVVSLFNGAIDGVAATGLLAAGCAVTPMGLFNTGANGLIAAGCGVRGTATTKGNLAGIPTTG